MKKTGLIIEAEVTNKGLNHFSVHRVSVNGEDWVKNEGNKPNIVDANNWVELIVEGITTIIMNCHDLKIKDSAEFLREVMGKLEQSFIVASNTHVSTSPNDKEYKSKNNNDNDMLVSN